MTPIRTTIEAADGRMLQGRLFSPQGRPRAVLVVLGALGVPQRYYQRFAEFLAARGVAVWTFDYRGCGESADRPHRRDTATLLDWARLDAAAVIDLARERFPDLPLWGLGHSFGGQAFGLTGRSLDLDGIIVVAAGTGDMSRYPTALRLRYQTVLALVPWIHRVFGYIPGQLGLGTDLPGGVVEQWAGWCATREYVRGALGSAATVYDAIRAPLLFVEVEDDTYAPAEAAAHLRSWYSHAVVDHLVLRPEAYGVNRIGHFGVFRPGAVEPFWEAVAARVAGRVDEEREVAG